MRVQVAAKGAQELTAAFGKRTGSALPQVLEVVGNLPVHGLADDLIGPVPDALHAFEPAITCPGRELVRLQGGNGGGRFTERLHLEGGSPSTFQPERNLIQCGNGIHLSIFAADCCFVHLAGSRFWIIPTKAL